VTIDATTLDTPVGRLTMLADDEVLVAAGFADAETMAGRLPGQPTVTRHDDLGRISASVRAYFAGDLAAIDDLPVSQPGGAFRQAAWKVMREVPAGETITYAELASRVGTPGAVRAAGSACARNLVAPIVPCHRIVRTGGALGGYYYGVATKDWLLAHERGW
jgi:methylated-DNA-[protein]-cysteine S-methyltransferase